VVDGVPTMVHSWVASASSSVALSVPLTVLVPATAVPSSREPASVTLPARAVAALLTTGTSLVPVMVTVMV